MNPWERFLHKTEVDLHVKHIGIIFYFRNGRIDKEKRRFVLAKLLCLLNKGHIK